MNWVNDIWSWLQSNSTLTNWIASIASVLTVIGIPTIVSMARTVTNAKENKSYRGVTLIRVFWIASFLVAVITEWIMETSEDEEYCKQIDSCDRLCDVKDLCKQRAKTLESRKERLVELSKTSSAKQAEFVGVPNAKKNKAEKKEQAQ